VFYLCRWKLRIAPPHYLNAIEMAPLLKMIGSFATQPFGLPVAASTPAGFLIVALMSISAALLAAWGRVQALLPERWQSVPPLLLPLLSFGLLVPVISAAQIFAGRGFQLAGNGFHRYEIFPIVGVLCALSAIAGLTRHALGGPGRSLPLHWAAIAGGVLLVGAVVSHYRMDRIAPWTLQFCLEVNRDRREFFDQLERVLQEAQYRNRVEHGYGHQADFFALPNLQLEQFSLRLEPDYLLQHYARALTSPHYDALLVPFAPLNPQHRALLIDRAVWPESADFYARYFPQQTTSLSAVAAEPRLRSPPAATP
jgi:hypothetical protein